MRWLTELNGNPRNTFVGFADGKHGTEIFGPHPELARQIVSWLEDTLDKDPADPKAQVTPKANATREFWSLVDDLRGIAKAAQLFHATRERDPHAYLFPEGVMNLAGYERLQAGKHQDAIALFTMNAEAYPASANAQDSLGDALPCRRPDRARPGRLGEVPRAAARRPRGRPDGRRPSGRVPKRKSGS